MLGRVLMGSEKKEIESHKNLLCLDDDEDLLYSLLKESEKILTKKTAKKLSKLTFNLDTGLRKSIALQRSRLLCFNAEDEKKLPKSCEKKVVIVKDDENVPMPAGKVIRVYKLK